MDSMEILNPFSELSHSISLEKAASMIKAGDYRLPEDPSQWNAAIQDSIESQHPNIVRMGSNPHIVYKNKDWGEGCAMGSISISVGKTLIVFPIIIRYGNLSPFDIAYVHNGDKWIHTSEENMREFESDNDSLFGEVTDKKMTGDNEYDDRWEYLAAPKGYDFKGGSRVFKGASSVRALCPIEPLDVTMKYAASHKGRVCHTSKEARRFFKVAAERVEIALDSLINSYDDEKPLDDIAKQPFEKVEHEEGTLKTTEDMPIKVASAYDDEENVPSIFAGQIPSESYDPLRVRYEEETNYAIDDPAFKTGAMKFFNLLHIKKAGLGQYEMNMGRRGYDGAFRVTGDIDKVASTIFSGDIKAASKVLDAVDDAEGVVVDSSIEDSNIGHIETLKDMQIVDDANRITRYGIYNVFTEAGEKETGHVLPVFDWSGEQTTMFLFISELNWALQSNINGTISGRQSKLPNGVLRPERRGSLVFDEKGKGIAFPPIEIKSVVLKKGGTVIRGTDLGSMKGVNLVMTKDVPGVMQFSESNDPDSWLPGHVNAYIPLGAKFVPLPKEITKIATAERAERALGAKFASLSDSDVVLVKTADKYTVEFSDDLCSYPEGISLMMKEATKVSYSGDRALNRKEAEFALKLGGTIMVDDVLTVAKEGSRTLAPAISGTGSANMRDSMIEAANINHYVSLPSRYKTAAKELRLDIEPILDVITLAPMLGKYARVVLNDVFDTAPPRLSQKIGSFKGAEYEDKPTLDDLFELGFLNDKSLRYYAEKIKDIEDLEDLLCKVLLTTRISAFGMEEDSAQNALYGVSELKNVLAKINFKLHRAE